MPMPPQLTPQEIQRRREQMSRGNGSPFMATRPVPQTPAPLNRSDMPMSPPAMGGPRMPPPAPVQPTPFTGAQATAGVTPPAAPVAMQGRTPAPGAIMDRTKELYAPVAGGGSPGGASAPPVGVAAPPKGIMPPGMPSKAQDAEAARMTGLADMFAAGAEPRPSGPPPMGGGLPSGSPMGALQAAMPMPGGMGGGGFGPFASKAQWAAQFAAEHGGQQPNAQDEMDAMSSFDFLAQKGRPPTDQEWKDRYYEGGFRGVQEQGGASYNQMMGGGAPMLPPGMSGPAPTEEMVTLPDGSQVPASILQQLLGGGQSAGPMAPPQGNPIINQWLPGWTY